MITPRIFVIFLISFSLFSCNKKGAPQKQPLSPETNTKQEVVESAGLDTESHPIQTQQGSATTPTPPINEQNDILKPGDKVRIAVFNMSDEPFNKVYTIDKNGYVQLMYCRDKLDLSGVKLEDAAKVIHQHTIQQEIFTKAVSMTAEIVEEK